MVTNRRKNDCGICAIANHTGLDYDLVEKFVVANKAKAPSGGTYISKVLPALGYSLVKIPRRGQENINAIVVTMARGSSIKTSRQSHAVAFKNGIVMDNAASEPLPIKEWRARFRRVRVVQVWSRSQSNQTK